MRAIVQRILLIAASIAAAMGLMLPASAQSANVTVSVTAETTLPTPGSTVRVALRFQPRPGWHIYWENPGDSGMPPNISWTLPAGFSASELQHPAPLEMEVAGFVSYIHEGDVTLLTELHVPFSAPVGQDLPIDANISFLACSDTLCVPQTANARLWLTVAENRSVRTKSFASFDQALPRELHYKGSVQKVGDTIEIRIRAANDAAGAKLFPITSGFYKASSPQQVRQEGGDLIFTIKADRAVLPSRFEGVFTSQRHPRGFRFLAKTVVPASIQKTPEEGAAENQITSDKPDAATSSSATPQTLTEPDLTEGRTADRQGSGDRLSPIDPAVSSPLDVTLLSALIGAIIGGLLLNLMPCVFPILSLKALSLARSGASEAKARTEGLSYTIGAIIACTTLGAVLLALRAAGTEVGWAFQLQNPLIILMLSGLITLIGLNLLGLFEISPITIGSSLIAKDGMHGSFWAGTLAAFIATPCSGPFMGIALGAALILPMPAALAIFFGLGLGLALPFLAVAFVPAVRHALPRPGPWMGRLRKILSIPMFITAAALLWVLSRQAGTPGLAAGVWLLASTGAILTWIGIEQRSGRRSIFGLLGLAACTVGALAYLSNVPLKNQAASPATDTIRPFSEEALAQLRAEGRPIFVDFTADWCLTCKVNERIAIQTDRTQAAFNDARVVTLLGDWTTGDPNITRFLAANGRNSIPFYLFYAPNGEVEVLPQILTPAILEGKAQHRR